MAEKNYIFIKGSFGILVKILHTEITYIHADKDYCRIHTDHKVFRINIGMDKFLSRLPSHMFFRCHKSFMVNVDRITAIDGFDITVGGARIPLSKQHKTNLLNMVNYIHNTHEDKAVIK